MLVKYSANLTVELRARGITERALNDFAAGLVEYPLRNGRIVFCDSAEICGYPVSWAKSADLILVITRNEGAELLRRLQDSKYRNYHIEFLF